MKVHYDYAKNEGRTEFQIPAISGIHRDDITPVNDYVQHNFSAGLDYTPSERHGFGLEYTFARLDFKDWSYSNDKVTAAQKRDDGYYNVSPSYEVHGVALSYRYSF